MAEPKGHSRRAEANLTNLLFLVSTPPTMKNRQTIVGGGRKSTKTSPAGGEERQWRWIT
jgi:hypothetical protein